MPIFEYRALDENGSTRVGIVDADTAAAARMKLRVDRVHVFEIVELKDQKDGGGKRGRKFKLRRGAVGELAIVTRQFATLLNAGIPVVDALKALIDQVESREMEQVFRDVREKVTQGMTIGEAMGKHPQFFSDLYVNMVKAGEASGNLDTIMMRLADYMQKQNRVRNKVTAALAYPAVMAVVGTVVVIILLTVVVPKIQDIFRETDTALPTITQVLISVSDFIKNYWWALLGGVVALWTAFKAWTRTEDGRYKWHGMTLRMPVMGILFKKQAIARFATTMATLLRSGLPVLNSLKIVQNVLQNKVLANALKDIHDSIVEGSDIATPLAKTGIFPPMVGYMIATGEQSGQLEEILYKLAEAYDEEVEIATQKMTSIMEPLIIVVLAVVVGFIVLAIVTPMIQMSGLA
ncbi:MAG: type II secretion system inner membrane protein GspF [Planctomycetes bacterium]|nr:type II secretion system inner membrane protein GspF [Planctomycetota bacterium]